MPFRWLDLLCATPHGCSPGYCYMCCGAASRNTKDKKISRDGKAALQKLSYLQQVLVVQVLGEPLTEPQLQLI